MIIELLNDEVAARVERAVAGLGYLYFDLDEVNRPVRRDELKKSARFNYLFCQESHAKDLDL